MFCISFRRRAVVIGFTAALLAVGVTPATAQLTAFPWGGLTRTYRLHTPPGYTPAECLPLVLSLHPGLSNADNHATTTKWHLVGDTARFLTLYPNGTSPGGSQTAFTWNAYNLSTGSTADDAGFLAALLDSVVKIYNVDTCRIYLTGFSNGAWMDWRMACDATVRFAAVGPVSGSWKYGTDGRCDHGGCNGSTIPGTSPPSQEATVDCVPSRTIPYLYYRGTAESTLTDRAITDPAGETFWRTHNGCAPVPVTDTIFSAGEQIIRRRYTGCAPGAETGVMSVVGASHVWHASATAELWRFFRRQVRCASATGGVAVAEEQRGIRVYPNPVVEVLYVEALKGSRCGLFDGCGRVLREQNFSAERAALDVHGLRAGVYWLEVVAEDGVRSVVRVVKP